LDAYKAHTYEEIKELVSLYADADGIVVSGRDLL
jgi:hypothetical protein